MCVYLYTHMKYKQNSHILFKQKLLFCMQLIMINNLKALVFSY